MLADHVLAAAVRFASVVVRDASSRGDEDVGDPVAVLGLDVAVEAGGDRLVGGEHPRPVALRRAPPVEQRRRPPRPVRVRARGRGSAARRHVPDAVEELRRRVDEHVAVGRTSTTPWSAVTRTPVPRGIRRSNSRPRRRAPRARRSTGRTPSRARARSGRARRRTRRRAPLLPDDAKRLRERGRACRADRYSAPRSTARVKPEAA